MKTPLHLDLLKEDERFSSSPVRLRVLMPLIATSLTFSLVVWLCYLLVRVHSQIKLEEKLRQTSASVVPAHDAVLESRAQEQEYLAMAKQLGLYCNSRVRFGDVLAQLPSRVPACVQFTELSIPQAPDALQQQTVPTNRFEQVTLRIVGRAGGDSPTEAINTLLAELKTPAFTNLFRSVFIPKGAFRQDTARNPTSRDTLLFEITCECLPRRFE